MMPKTEPTKPMTCESHWPNVGSSLATKSVTDLKEDCSGTGGGGGKAMEISSTVLVMAGVSLRPPDAALVLPRPALSLSVRSNGTICFGSQPGGLSASCPALLGSWVVY